MNFFMFSGIVLLFLVLPVSVIITIVFAVEKKEVLIPAICMPTSFIIGIIFLCIGGFMYGQTDEYKQAMAEKEQQEELLDRNSETDESSQIEENIEGEKKAENSEVAKEETTTELTEEEYKALCKEISYNSIDESYVGKYVYKEIIFGRQQDNGEYSCGALEDFNEGFDFYQHTNRVYSIKDCRIDKTFPIESDDVIKIYGVVDSVSKSYRTGGYNPTISVHYIEYIRKYGKEAEQKTMQEIAEERRQNYQKAEEEKNYKNSLNTDYTGQTKNIEGMDELSLEEYISHCDKMNYSNLYNGENFVGRDVCIHVQLFSHKKFNGDKGKQNVIGDWETPERIKDDVWEIELYSEQAEQYVADFGRLYFLNSESIFPENNKKGQNIVIYGKIINQPQKDYDDWEIIVRYYENE